MSKKAGRLGDIGSAHGCFPPTPTISGSPDIIINGRPAIRVGDSLLLHGCGNCAPHPRAMAKGSSSVLFNGKPACRVGDGIDCGGSLSTGSSNVLIGEYNGSEDYPDGADSPYAAQIEALRFTDAAFCEICTPDIQQHSDFESAQTESTQTENSQPVSSDNFDSIIKDILAAEGGYVNHPNDPGGHTNKGITFAVFEDHAKEMLSVEPTLDQLKALTDEQAKTMYKALYWDPMHGDQITNKSVAHIMLDMSINSGNSRAVKTMQQTLNELGSTLKVDGVVGPATIEAINSVESYETLFDHYKTARQDFYNVIIERNPNLEEFKNGWKNRLDAIQYVE